jgi:hypothetical protein
MERFEKLVPAGERSRVIEDALAERVEEIEADRLRSQIKEGLAYMADVYAETAEEWKHVDAEGWPAE